MANRVTEAEVKQVINTDLSDAIVLVHIGIANDLVTGLLGTSGLGAARLKNIELYLSAHFCGIRDRDEGQVTAQWAGEDGKMEYNKSLGEAFKSTFFGQQALVLDTTGTLNTLGRERAQFRTM